ncbi:2'-5' RNA ligase family protein [Leifsonia sp. 2MCAF36]|uniref:2'-5' RNA ligase family protein n=1 Tax=Leifsonia sp. 2MCAF36 TaxID=3232988 RepID=UPI003F96E725
MSTFALIFPLSQIEDGTAFPVSQWPLHATIVPPFETPAGPTAIANTLRPIAKTIEPFAISGHHREQFGERRDISVTTLLPVDRLQTLHRLLSDAVTTLGAAPLEPQYHHHGFAAHITDNETDSFSIGEHHQIDQLTLVDMRTEQPGANPRALLTLDLGQETRHPAK